MSPQQKASKKYYEKNKDLVNKRAIEFKKKNPDKVRLYKAKRRAKIKLEVLRHYSKERMTCAVCNYSDIRALDVDHVNNDGYKHRRDLGNDNLHSWLKRNNFPEGFQVLCRNCNWIKYIEELKQRSKACIHLFLEELIDQSRY